jgi:SAM domain (Sterile alpha motif)
MDVGDWLRSLGLGQYEAAFLDNEIDGAMLPKLTVDDLKDLGVAAVGHRRKILSAIEELNPSSAAPDGCGANAGDRHKKALGSLTRITRQALHSKSQARFCF